MKSEKELGIKFRPKPLGFMLKKNFSIHPRVFCREDTKAQSFTKINVFFQMPYIQDIFFICKRNIGLSAGSLCLILKLFTGIYIITNILYCHLQNFFVFGTGNITGSESSEQKTEKSC